MMGCLLFAGVTVTRMEAQSMSTGSLSVTVKDPSGAVINGAQLKLTDLQTNDVHTATTSGSGTATIPYLDPAPYSLEVMHKGFSTKIYPSVTIQANQVTDITVTMAVGATTQSVTVSGAASPLLHTTPAPFRRPST